MSHQSRALRALPYPRALRALPYPRALRALILAVAVVLLVPGLAGSPASAAAASHPPVVVSLTFDDTTSDQLQADALMAKYGMVGTFFVNAGRLGANGYMTPAQVHQLESRGNEIAGHTVSHADLPTLDPDEAKRQICNDRSSLLQQGFDVRDFAYPYGDNNAAVQQLVHDCGYNSARAVGDIVSPGTCNGCAFAETVPPANAYRIRTPDSIKQTTSLVDMQTLVLQAEQHSGGWVVLVMHHVCDGCNPYSVSPATLDSFLSWLKPRASKGTTVRLMRDVVGGSLQPQVAGPPPPPPLSTDNLVRNPSMESISTTTNWPTCWQKGGYGTNTAAWSTTSDAQDGSTAIKVSVSSFTDGDRRILTQQDLGSCAPATSEGHSYDFSGYYLTDGSVRPVAYYRTSAGGWVFLAQGPVLPTSPTYTKMTWRTPAMPAGSTAIAVAFSLRSIGTLQADSVVLRDADSTGPSVSVTSPVDGSRVRGTITIAADASDSSGVSSVDIFVNGSKICSDTAAPYSCTYDTTGAPDSVIAVTARATDTAGNVSLSTGLNYTVSNSVAPDTTPPTVSLTSPADGSTASGTVSLAADAADNDGITEVLWTANGENIAASSSSPYQAIWDVSGLADGTAVTLTATAVDRSGNTTTTAPVTVTVSSPTPDTTPPTAAIASPADGSSITGTVYIKAAATDDVGVARVYFYVDSTYLGSRTVTPYQWKWDTTTVTKGAHILKVVVADTSGNKTTSAPVTVTVS